MVTADGSFAAVAVLWCTKREARRQIPVRIFVGRIYTPTPALPSPLRAPVREPIHTQQAMPHA